MKRVAALVLIIAPLSVPAETVTDVSSSTDKTYELKIDGQPYVAITKAQRSAMVRELERIDALEQELATARSIVEKHLSLEASYEKLKKDYVVLTDKYKVLTDDSLKLGERYSKASNDLVALNKEYGGLVKDYDALVQKYRDIAVRTAPRHPFDLGLGVVHSEDEDHAVAMAGMGTQFFGVELRGWVFGGQDTYGVMVGTSF